MTIIYLNEDVIRCPYCKKNVQVRILKQDGCYRKICPKCELTIEVIKRKDKR